jgi:hypothetical protein
MAIRRLSLLRQRGTAGEGFRRPKGRRREAGRESVVKRPRPEPLTPYPSPAGVGMDL